MRHKYFLASCTFSHYKYILIMKTCKISYGLIFAIAVLALIVIATTMLSTRKIQPYNAFGKFASNNIEGMTSTKDQGQDRVRYAEYPVANATNEEDTHLIDSIAASDTAQRVSGLAGGLYGPMENNEKITTFADAQGSLAPACQRASSGMSNSTGYLWLDRTQLNLLTTRGGNQTCSTCYKMSCGCNK